MRIATVFSIATLGLAAGVFSNPGVIGDKRDLASIEGVVQAVTTQVDLVDSDIKAGNLNKVISDSTQLVSVINSGVTTVDASAPLVYADALTLSTKIGTLITAVNTTINDLIGASKGVEAAGLVSTTLSNLKDQYAASNSLAAAITSKVPTTLQGLSKELAGYITASIQRGIDYYSSLPATSSTPASSPTKAPTSSPTKAPTSSPTKAPTSAPTSAPSSPASSHSSPASSHSSPASSPTSSPSHGATTTGGAKTSKKPCSTTGSSSTAPVKPTTSCSKKGRTTTTSGMAGSTTGVSMTLTTITTTITTTVPCSGTSTGSTGPSYTPTTITTTITTAVPCSESSGAPTTVVNTPPPAGSTTEVVVPPGSPSTMPGGVMPTWTSVVAPGPVVSTSVPSEPMPAPAVSSSTPASPSVPQFTGGASVYKMDISYYGMAAVAAIAFAL